jgi:glycosyltransferase involved in cell wall biosynthesis
MSVVVAAFSGEPALGRCLESLAPQCAEVEVVVAADREVVDLERRFPSVRFLPAHHGAGVFRLRALGVSEARGELVALTEDHCTVAPGWVRALLDGYRAGHALVGGPVDNGLTTRAFDWAMYLCEYAAYMPPLPEGPVKTLLAVNVAYERRRLLGCRDTWHEAFYENEVQDALRDVVPWLVEKAVVTSHLVARPRAALVHFYRGGRRYGEHRKSTASPAARILLPLAALAVPALLVWRRIRTVARRRPRLLATVARALPAVVALDCAWAAGEAAGYLAPRRS